ncbi:MAG: hypothetical protein SF051_03330 [Elusimicrobiota bacterium]|nr:hypothetical protein [Elusimicrobiota bacterium]
MYALAGEARDAFREAEMTRRLGVLTTLLFLTQAAAAATLTPIDRMSTPWLQELYEASLRAKESEMPAGLCRGAQGLYRYADRTPAFERDAAFAALIDSAGRAELADIAGKLGQEGMLVTVLDAMKATLQAFIDRNYDERVRRVVAIAGPTKTSDPAEVSRFVERAVADPALAAAINARAAEFGPGRKLLYHADTMYGRRETPESQPQQSVISFFILIDAQRGELSLVGNGDCEF